MTEAEIENYQIIIDEDILRTVLSTDMISIDELRNICNKISLPDDMKIKINYLCGCKGITEKIRYITYRGLYDFEGVYGDITDIEKVDSNLYGLIRSSHFAVDSNYIHFLDERFLTNRKLIIMSATVDADMYRRLYPNRTVHLYECRKVRYIGKVLQYADYSYSRFTFEQNPFLVDELKNRVEKQVVITLKCIENEFKTKYHFGNVEGLNSNSGKDITVIGLPNLHEIVYGLYGLRMGVSGDEVHMCSQKVEFGEYKFKLNSFKNGTLRNIQLWLLSSQLEQAVGRARLLRNDCTVTVYSGFPIEQAEIIDEFDVQEN